MMSNIKVAFGLLIICAVAVDSFRPVALGTTYKTLAKPSTTTLFSSSQSNDATDRIELTKKVSKFFKGSLLAFFAAVQMANARPEGVNRPDLLPKEANVPLIDVANFLSKGQEKKVVASINELQKVTGWKLRILCQSYPETPGLAIKDYWGVDDNTIVLVVDSGEGFNKKMIPTNIMNLNIGKNVDLQLPSQFWLRLTNKLGNQPYVKAKGTDVAVLNAVEAITYCLSDTEKTCRDLPFNLD